MPQVMFILNSSTRIYVLDSTTLMRCRNGAENSLFQTDGKLFRKAYLTLAEKLNELKVLNWLNARIFVLVKRRFGKRFDISVPTPLRLPP